MANEITKVTAKSFLQSPEVQKRLAEQLGKRAGQFTTSLLSLIGNDALLTRAEPKSLLNAAMTAASLDLPINKNLGFAYIIGYENKKKGIVEAQFQIGARGFKQLAMRTGEYRYINDSDVREGELVKRDRLSGAIEFEWNDNEAIRTNLPVIGYVSYFELHNGYSSTLYMTMDEIEAHALQYSQSYKTDKTKGWTSSPWTTNRLAMSLKTVTKLNISKNGPMSTELQRAIEADQAAIDDGGEPHFIDNEANKPEKVDAADVVDEAAEIAKKVRASK